MVVTAFTLSWVSVDLRPQCSSYFGILSSPFFILYSEEREVKLSFSAVRFSLQAEQGQSEVVFCVFF